MSAAAPVVELKQITKRFPGIVANDSISLTLEKGEIHALLGENGAGKSTLMNIVFGLYQPDEGSIEIDGKPVIIDSPNKAIELGIGMVHQHFKLVEPFTVTENIVLGMEPKKDLKSTINPLLSRFANYRSNMACRSIRMPKFMTFRSACSSG